MFRDIYTYNAHICSHSSGTLSFFNATGSTKKAVNKISTSATASTIASALNNLLTALADYGLISST